MRIGSQYLGDGNCEFIVWAPLLKSVKLHIIYPDERCVLMSKDKQGYWRTVIGGIHPRALYFYQLNDSAEDRWGGPGSSLPDKAITGQELTTAPLSFILFEA